MSLDKLPLFRCLEIVRNCAEKKQKIETHYLIRRFREISYLITFFK